MYIDKIRINNFRNYEIQDLELNKNINVFYGENAQGKTNILEAIFIAALGKSFRAKKDKELINMEKNKATVEIVYEKKDRTGKIKYEIEDKKNVFLNGIKIQRLSEILGNINVVMFSPDDIGILKEGPQRRRKFLNMLISQLKPRYIHNFNLYIKTLEQRNNYLKQIKYEYKSEELLDVWDEKLAEYAEVIYNYRKEFIEKIRKKIKDIHFSITENKENIDIKYISDFLNKEDFLNKINKKRKIDIQKGFSSIGIHRDDFIININNKQVDIYGSQGQNRSAILSLKLSELYVIEEEIGEYPILLLDDFMSELDSKRRKNFLSIITEAQVLITGTEKIVLEKNNFNVYNVKQGKIIKE